MTPRDPRWGIIPNPRWATRRSLGLCGGLALILATWLAPESSTLEGCGSPGGGGSVNLGGGGARAPRNPGSTAGNPGSGARGPAAPGNTSPLPGAGTGPPAGAGARPQDPLPGSEAGIKELSDTYGIQLRGDYNEGDVQNAIVYARNYRPQETNGLTFTFTADRRASGVLGVWSNGRSQIYSSKLDVVFHEGSHHITLFQRNSRTRQLARQLFDAASGGSGTPDPSTITRSYAQTNFAEFCAEFMTGLAGLERGVPLTFTVRNDAFNPPEEVRAVARQIYTN